MYAYIKLKWLCMSAYIKIALLFMYTYKIETVAYV